MPAGPLTTRTAAVALAVAVVLVAATSAGVAVDEPRDAPADTSPPVRVYVSETLDISNVQLTGGGTIGTNRTTFVSVTGDEVFTVDPENADFDDIEPGSYDAQSDDDESADLLVVEPRITDLDVRNERGVDVAGDRLAADDFEEVTITVEYNFAEADRLEVDVEDPDGFDLAGNRRITESGGSVTVDTSSADPGTYRISVEGSNVEDGAASTTVTVAGAARPTATATATPTATSTATPTPEPTPTPTPASTPTTTPTPASTPTTTPTPTATESDGSGFGPVVAILTLLAVGILARRHGR